MDEAKYEKSDNQDCEMRLKMHRTHYVLELEMPIRKGLADS